MINELIWDSKLLNRKIGELKIASESLPQIETALGEAKKDEFKYIICKLQAQQTALITLLESLGFYLSDIGVTWEVKSDKFLYKNMNESSAMIKIIKIATEKDIYMLKEMVKSLFLESRFYNDPFFSKEEADNIYQMWIENSVMGNVADIVFHIPNMGFVTCKKSTHSAGEIVLIGVKKDFRGKGIGTILIEEAIKWFRMQGINFVSVRTQLKNLNSMNFYVSLGFYIKGYDIVFAKIL
jgi:dTDP-4-amino-4,6-dideoxy-D-galactose acyltransferase